MEHSSPLAAMQPPTMFYGHCFRAEPTSYTTCGPQSGIGPSPFNFKDLSMKKGQGDYFGMDPVRGSSPTASLAADLSQNFHIDQRFVTPSVHVTSLKDLLLFLSFCVTKNLTSPPKTSPQLTTPRRSLFSSNLFAQANGHGKRHKKRF